MSQPSVTQGGFALPDAPSSNEGILAWIKRFRDALNQHLADLANSVLGNRDDMRREMLTYYIPSVASTSVYAQGTAAAAYIFPLDVAATRLTVQADVGAGATLTVAVYNGAEAAGNIALTVVSGVGAGRVALQSVTPANAGKEVFLSGDGATTGDKCYAKVTSAGGMTTEISIQLQAEPR